ncbi:twin-arginine translocase subunit TatC, partial [Pseudomonas aeruginosa]|uniref:twin-arginine translocase subunit TatC n=1 Tax=Pseudomonas aeruginosa TaxID=287 RepID=UPI00396A86C1
MSADKPEQPEHDQEMPLVSHLTELRTRLLRSVAAIFLIFAGLFYFSQKIYTLVSEPLRHPVRTYAERQPGAGADRQ